MLVLTRRAGESIMIDDDIELKVLKIRSQVHIGIDAPKRAAVHRKEVWHPERATRRDASTGRS
jgi:carbon storage regulator